MIPLNVLNDLLKNVSKDIIIRLLHEYVRFETETQVHLKVIDIKMDLNLEKQKDALLDLDLWTPYEGKDYLKWYETHQEWERLNDIYNKIYKEYELLSKERNRIKENGGKVE